jgi:hypothetical protein
MDYYKARSQEPGVRSQESGARIKELGARIKELTVNGKLLSSIEYLKSAICNLKQEISGFQVSGVRCQGKETQKLKPLKPEHRNLNSGF